MTVQPPPPPSVAPVPPSVPSPPVHDGKIRFFRTFALPFLDKPWHWIPNLLAITGLSYIPVLGWMIAWGWSLDIAHRYRAAPRAAIPRWNSVMGYVLGWLRFLWSGMVVFLVEIVFYKLPCLLLTVALFFQQMVILHGWLTERIMDWWANRPGPSYSNEELASIAGNWVVENIVWITIKVLVTVAFASLAQLVFAGGVVRYTRTGSLWSFVQPFRNLWLVMRCWSSFARVLVYWLILKLILLVLWIILTSTGVGTFFVPVTFALDFWFLGYLYGQLAARVDLKPKEASP